MSQQLVKFVVLLVFLCLETLCALMWVCGSFGAGAVTTLLLGYTPDDGTLAPLFITSGIWALLFAIPEILLMTQTAIWCRGLTKTADDLSMKLPPVPDLKETQ